MARKIYLLSALLLSVMSITANYPKGYYKTLNGKKRESLKTALHKIICKDTTHYLKYGAGKGHTWSGFYITDRDESDNSVIDMYSNQKVYWGKEYVQKGYKGFSGFLDIEHCVPKSWWHCNMRKPDCAALDLHQLYPSNSRMNRSKSNHPLGVVLGIPTKDNGLCKVGKAIYRGYRGNVFEPADEYKGDFARSYFYVATAYQNYQYKWKKSAENMMEANTYPTLKPWAIRILLKWHRQDPVSDKERQRTDKVFSIQHNRNPFIDYPELIEYIWGTKVDMVWNEPNSNINDNSNNNNNNIDENCDIYCYAKKLNNSFFVYKTIVHIVIRQIISLYY